MKYTNILFDLDGTITDPREGILNSLQYAMKKCSIVENDREKLTRRIGQPLHEIFEELYGFSREEAMKAVGYYREYFTDTGIFENRLYAGMDILLKKLAGAKCSLILATSKPTVYAEKILRHFDIDQYFDEIVGSNLDGTMTDKSEIIRHIIISQKLSGAETVIVGDSIYDIAGAKNNGIDSIAVTFGYGLEQELKEAGPTHIVDSVEELHELLLVTSY